MLLLLLLTAYSSMRVVVFIKSPFFYSLLTLFLLVSHALPAAEITWWKLTQQGTDGEWILKVTETTNGHTTQYYAEIVTGLPFPAGLQGDLLRSINETPCLISSTRGFACQSRAGGREGFFGATHLYSHFFTHMGTVADQIANHRGNFIRPECSSYGGLITLSNDNYIDPRIPVGLLTPPYSMNSIVIPEDLQMIASLYPAGNQHNITLTFQLNPQTLQATTQLTCMTASGEQFFLTELHPSENQFPH